MKQTQAPSTNLSSRKPSKVSEMQMKAKKMQVTNRKRRNLVVKRKTSEVEEDNEGEKEVGEEEKEAGDEEKEPAEKDKEPAKEGDEMEPRRNDEEAEERTTQSVREHEAHAKEVEGPTIPAIGGGSNNAESGHTDAYSMEAPRVEALKAMEGRLMNAISDGMKEVNKKVKSLSNRLTLVENEVKSLRVSVPRMSELLSEGEIDNSSDQDGSDNLSEEDGGDTPSEEDGGDTSSEEDKDGGSKNDSVLAIANQVQSEHGNGDDDMDDTA
ncbi:hypothetical protein DY000_02048850 [Brassica cretica]|uniref:Uncharacterized protein n=1 Tax=Brassica cretica TaxID=69181 RepID=A0ABQ7EXE8_BRACR|nr:hypothetical protein DY000_02048850 [Brassica cretica]